MKLDTRECTHIAKAVEPKYLSSQLKQYYHNWFETKPQDIMVGVSLMLNNLANTNRISAQLLKGCLRLASNINGKTSKSIEMGFHQR